MTITEARRQFPHTWTDLVYANHAAVAPLMFRVRDAVDAYMTRRALKGIEPYPWAVRMMLDTKQLLAQLLHASAEDIAFVANTSTGVNIMATAIDWQPGDRVAVSDLEFPANVYPFLNLKRLGVEVDVVASERGMVTPDAVRTALTARTKLLSLSSVQYLSGHRTDVAAMGALCRERGILFAVDAIQSLPHVPIDVVSSQIDFLTCGSHKWMMSPEGLGFIYASERMRSMTQAAYLGWTSVMDAFNFTDLDEARVRSDAGRYEIGMLNYASIAGMKAALEFFFEFGIERVARQVLDLSGYLIDRLSAYGVEVITPAGEQDRAGIVTIAFDEAEATVKRLEAQKIVVSLRTGKIRISPHFYNTEEEMRRLLVELLRKD